MRRLILLTTLALSACTALSTPTPEPTLIPNDSLTAPALPSDNLLRNPGFEEGCYYQNLSQELCIPGSWSLAWRDGGLPSHDPTNTQGYARPECQAIPAQIPFLDPPRVRSGEYAHLCFTTYKIGDFSLYQIVPVEPGQHYVFSAYGHAWSTSTDSPTSQTADFNDRRNANFQLGIDPFGGVDPFEPEVIWGQVTQIYDAYGPIPAVTAQAQGPLLTVFIRTYSLWAFRHNDFYLDDAELMITSAPSEPLPTSSPAPTLPSVPYRLAYGPLFTRDGSSAEIRVYGALPGGRIRVSRGEEDEEYYTAQVDARGQVTIVLDSEEGLYIVELLDSANTPQAEPVTLRLFPLRGAAVLIYEGQ